MRAAKVVTVLLLVSLACLVEVDKFRPAQVSADDYAPGYWDRTPLPQMGIATFYSSGTMDWVWNYRRQHADVPECPECVGAVALLRAGDIGRKVWLQPPGGELAGPFLVIDCARTEDVLPLLDRGWVVDISYELGQMWGMDRPLDGVVVWADPEDEQKPRPAGAPTPFYIDPSKVEVTAPTPTPQAAPTADAAWPTRLPAPLAPPVAQVTSPSATPEVVAPTSPRPIAGTPTITVPTPPGGAPPTATSPPQTPERAATGVAQADAGKATATPAFVALGRPGAELLMSAGSITGRSVPRQLTVTVRPDANTPPRATSPLILPPVGTPLPPLPESPSQAEVSTLVRLWQALLDLVAH